MEVTVKFSVIIPVYKAENTIKRCLDSLLDQPHEDAELIVINDGSPDGSASICRAYAARHSCVRYFEKENGGVSSTRNMGLEHARGEYVTFVDSDDYVSADYFEVLNANTDAACDLLVFGSRTYNGNTFSQGRQYEAAAGSAEETATLLSDALRMQMLNSPCNKAFRRALLEKHRIRFDHRLPIGEDKVFVVQYTIHAQAARFIPNALYICSVENRESLSRKPREDLCTHILLEHRLLFEAAEASAYKERYREAISFSFYRSAYTVISELYKFDHTARERREKIRDICAQYGAVGVRDYGGLKHWLMALPIRWKCARAIDLLLRLKR